MEDASCLISMPWKIIKQTGKRLSGEDINLKNFQVTRQCESSEVECFNWKWSPDGRYGIDLPGGRDKIIQNFNDFLSVFDMHTLSWQQYKLLHFNFEIPRAAFLYWLSCDIICVVTLMHPDENDEREMIKLIFCQTFLKICHKTKQLTKLDSVIYETDRTIPVNYWYHIFENRSGEPFLDANMESWLIFSNGKDSLILIPYVPKREKSRNRVRYVDFDMDSIVAKNIGCQISLDPYFCTHYVPFVYKNEINFMFRINQKTCEFGHGYNETINGIYQLQINLAKVMENKENASFDKNDINIFRKLHFDPDSQHIHYSQYKNMLTFFKWKRCDRFYERDVINQTLPIRYRKCVQQSSFGTIDLETDQENTFHHIILPNDVLSFHPSGSLLAFRYKEDYEMLMCCLPFYKPLPLSLITVQTLNNCINLDPNCIIHRKCIFHSSMIRSTNHG
ncbi:unnamed protein product [Caenorhabditis angaria]|uniref:Uncharacterized protein n=1 Tax=Caenorhabditis angaria TaxID=860376 RepID=A0A9P1IJG9_9PELO|nr:unnamed protein product [Caenorhabditis angaria]